ncbi:MAG: succinate dehydrogenase, cytochrome b556 subunit [Chloroflexota bacterium]
MAVTERAPERPREGEKLAEIAPPATSGSYAWITQRITAVLLLAFLGTHWWIAHFAPVGEAITFERVSLRLENALLVFVDAGLLAIVIYHALNGVRNVVVDFNIGRPAERVLSILLLVVGILAFIYGINALLPFTTGTALFYR